MSAAGLLKWDCSRFICQIFVYSNARQLHYGGHFFVVPQQYRHHTVAV
jgi:hypothetical protein